MPSIVDPPGSSPIAHGVDWLQGAALGGVATVIAVVAIAAVGLMMLSGRIELRRGVSVVLGCFILFGSTTLATAIAGAVNGDTPPRAPAPGQLPSDLLPPSPPPNSYDPYAGASVPNGR
jgi:type IV secretory pathway VirB2 component (pilin)